MLRNSSLWRWTAVRHPPRTREGLVRDVWRGDLRRQPAPRLGWMFRVRRSEGRRGSLGQKHRSDLRPFASFRPRPRRRVGREGLPEKTGERKEDHWGGDGAARGRNLDPLHPWPLRVTPLIRDTALSRRSTVDTLVETKRKRPPTTRGIGKGMKGRRGRSVRRNGEDPL